MQLATYVGLLHSSLETLAASREVCGTLPSP
jgi:hypothetical protein